MFDGLDESRFCSRGGLDRNLELRGRAGSVERRDQRGSTIGSRVECDEPSWRLLAGRVSQFDVVSLTFNWNLDRRDRDFRVGDR